MLRGCLVLVLLTAYFGLWGHTARQAYIEHVATPVLTSAVSSASAHYTIDARPASRTLVVNGWDAASLRHVAPAGFRFLLPAFFLVLFAPRKRYWVGLWLGHIGLALLGLLLLAAGLVLHEASFAVYRLSSEYLVDAFSLGIATLAVVRERDLQWRKGGAPPTTKNP